MELGERFNTVTHLLGLVLAIMGAVTLGMRAGIWTGSPHAVGALIFAVCVVLLYAASSLCHGTRGPGQRLWQRMDHAAIFLLIAGTATPFALRAGADGWDAAGLALVWGLAAVGILIELRRQPERGPSVVPYVAVGWVAVAVALRACLDLPAVAGALLVAGGAIYTAGTVFYRNPYGLRHAHGIWHLFVLSGTAVHYAAVLSFAS